MARARNIKPGFFKNEYLAAIPMEARMLFIGLWAIADKSGRLEDRPARIKAEVFPYDPVDVERCLSYLAASPEDAHPFIYRYVVDGRKFIQIVNWERHQNPHKNETETGIPPYKPDSSNYASTSEKLGGNREDSRNAPMDSEKIGSTPADSLIPDSLNTDSLIPDSLNTDSDETEPRAPSVNGKNSEAVSRVFSYYQTYHPTSRITEDRRKMILARLKEGYSVDDLCSAIDGLHQSPHHRGENDRNTAYLDIQYAIRKGEAVAKMMAVAARPPSAMSTVSLFNSRASEEFLATLDEMEARHAARD